jgi:hypothetical protein
MKGAGDPVRTSPKAHSTPIQRLHPIHGDHDVVKADLGGRTCEAVPTGRTPGGAQNPNRHEAREDHGQKGPRDGFGL